MCQDWVKGSIGSMTSPVVDTRQLMPLFVLRSRGRRFSTARKTANCMCWTSAGTDPDHTSLDMFRRKSAPLATKSADR